jgi:putative ABC transport system ATP-binding protein
MPSPDGLSISVRRLRKHFEGGLVRALDGVDLEIAACERVAITGPTGCGKSTLLSLLALLERPDQGELVLGGTRAPDIRNPDRWRAENLGIVFQFHHLLPHLSAEENVQLPLIGRGAPREEVRRRSREMLAAVGLGHRASFLVAKLSGGERQLAALARALIAGPALVLADEPTGSVDSRTGERILGLLLDSEFTRRTTVALVTHDHAVAARADRVVPMLDGRIGPDPGAVASAAGREGAGAAARG